MSAMMYGPEIWKVDDIGEWSYWDLWFCTLCLVDHGGNWDALDQAIWKSHRDIGREIREAKWSHLVNLRERLELAGLTAATLIGTPDKRTATKARNKLIKSTSLQRYAITEPMRDLPSGRLTRRAMSGWWEKFPVSPGPAYRLLDADIDLVERVLREVKSEYRAARMSWHADTAGAWHACVAMAADHVSGGHGR